MHPLIDGGWGISFNEVLPSSIRTIFHLATPRQAGFDQFAGSRNVDRYYWDGATENMDRSPNLPEPIPSQRDFKPGVIAHIEGVVNADLSSTIIVFYNDGLNPPFTTFTFGVAPGSRVAPSSILAFGNNNCNPDLFFFDNLDVRASQGVGITSVSPTSGQQGQNVTVTVNGSNTHFAAGSTTVDFGADVTLNSVTVLSATSLTANISIAAPAVIGVRVVTVTTGTEVASLANGFLVTAAAPTPSISSITPNSGQQGQGGPVTVVGQNTHFVQGTTQLDIGPGITVSSVTVSCPTCLTAQVLIADNAPIAPHDVRATTGTEIATLAGGFTVQPGTPIIASFAPISVQQGQQSVTLTITGKFTHFTQGATQVSLGSGITTNSVAVSGATALAAQISVDPAATIGTRTLTVTTGSEVVSVSDVFTVKAASANQAPTVSAGPDQTTRINANLLINPGNEIIPIVPGSIPGWTQVAGAWTQAPAETGPFPPTIEGITYFYPGAIDQAELSQDIDVKAFTGGIEAGTQQFDFKGYVRTGNETPSDIARVVIEFRDATNTVALGGRDSGPTPSPNAWTPLLSTFTPPPGTAWLCVRLLGTRNTGTTNDTYFDGLSIRPISNAGVRLNGTASDDGLPPGSTLSTTWIKLSGPGAVTFGSVNQPQSSADFTTPGDYVLQLSASDSQLTSVATTKVTVNSQNQVPTVSAGSNQTITLPNTAALTGTATDDGLPSGSSLFLLWSKVDGPGTVTFGNRNALSTTASFSTPGAYKLRLMASDSDQFANAEVTITVNPATQQNQPPTADAGPDRTVTLPNTLTLNYTVTDDGRPLGGTLTISWEMVSGPAQAFFSNQMLNTITVAFTQAGTYVLRLTADDTQFKVSDDVTVTVTGNTNTGPTVSITSPVDGDVITSRVNVIGIVSSPTLANWKLEYGRDDMPTRTLIASGTTPVSAAPLGTFDPTLVLNGLSRLFLTATDAGGNSSTTSISVTVDRNQKVGNFTVSFNDLSVPVVGIPIDIRRTYDSRDKRKGDFGIGWQLGVKAVQLQKNGALGAGWSGTRSNDLIPTYCVQPPASKTVTITFVDGRVFRFQPKLSVQCQQIVPPNALTVTYGFTPLPGTVGSLAPVGNDQVFISASFPGPAELFDAKTFDIYDAQRFRLTLQDGRSLIINATTGLESIADLNGNTVTFSMNGITHSAGKSVTFTRDSIGRITEIKDPAGNSMFYTYDAAGDLVSFKDRENNITTFSYFANHNLDTIKDPRGINPLRNIYDDSGRLIKSVDAFGKEILYDHQIGTRQEIITDRLGNITVHEYDDRGNIVRTTDAEGGVTLRKYDANDNVIEETNALSKTTFHSYDAQNNLTMTQDPLGGITRYTYNSRGQVLTTLDANNNLTENLYDTVTGNLLQTKDAEGGTTFYTYWPNGLRKTMKDVIGGVTSYTYDSFGNLRNQQDPDGRVTDYEYDQNGNRTKQTTYRTTPSGPETIVTQYQYDKLNRLITTIYPDNSTTQIKYNAIGKQETTTDQRGFQTTYGYDDLGRLTQTTYPDLTTESNQYDAEGHRTLTTDRGNQQTQFIYDKVGRLKQTIHLADNTASTTVYDLAGQVKQVTNERGFTTKYAYDDAGRRTTVTDALNNVTKSEYDAGGNLTKVTDANLNVTQYIYDRNNRRTRTIYPDSTQEKTDYDALGRTQAKTDQANKVTQFKYDPAGRLIEVIDALSQSTKYAYDEVGNRISQTDANNHTTRFQYDKLGRRTRRELPLGMFETFQYDPSGNVQVKTDFNGRSTSYEYDRMNRLTRKVPDPVLNEPSVTFAYTPTGQRSQMVDVSGMTTYQYDTRDTLRVKATPQGTLTYTYDASGNLATLRSSNANGSSVDYFYDELNRLQMVRDNRLSPGITRYTYDKVGNLKGYVYPNNVQHNYSYDTLNRLKDLSVAAASTTVASYNYTLAPAGNRTKVAELGGRTVDYAYDDLYRLKSETISGAPSPQSGTISYNYDAVGNRLSRTSSVSVIPNQTFTYDPNDRLASDTYDANGNTISTSGTSYHYDFENHLATSNSSVSVVYDGDGNRVARTVSGVTTRFLVDDRNITRYAQVLEEVQSGAVQRVFTYGLNRISQSQASGTSFYGYDGRGSVRMLTDATGAITDRYDYDAFGNIISQAGTTPNVYLYSGEQLDPSLGLYYLRARYTSPSSGRFLTADPWGGASTDPASLHKYLFARNDPVNRTDPSGRQFTLVDLTLTLSINATIESVQAIYTGQLVRTLFDVKKIAYCCIDPAAKLQNVALNLVANGGPDWALDLYNTASEAQAQGYQIIAKRIAQTYRNILESILNVDIGIKFPLIDKEIKRQINLADVAGLPDFSADLKAFDDKLNQYTHSWADLLTGAANVNECDVASFLAKYGGDYFDKVVSKLSGAFGER